MTMAAIEWIETRAEIRGRAFARTKLGDTVGCKASMGKKRWCHRWDLNGQLISRREAVYELRGVRMETDPSE